MKYSLIIPCYNEAKNLPLLLARCELLSSSDFEVIIVDNGSTDETADVLIDLLPSYPGCSSIRVPVNMGYGYGIVEGLKCARGSIIGWTHADLQTDPCDALRAVKIFEAHGTDLFVKGRRYGRPYLDVIFTVAMSIFETVLLRRRMSDINAQPTMFSREFFLSWAYPPADFSLDLYAYYLGKEKGLKEKRFAVKFGERAHGASHWNVDWKSKMKFIRRTVDFSLQLRKRIKP